MENHFRLFTFLFWQRWLFYTSVLFACAGISFAMSGSNLLFLPYDKMVANALWQHSQLPADANVYRAFICLPYGGTIACCYILLAFIARYPFMEKKVWARNAIISAFGLWAIIDSMGCLYFKVYAQIYFINAFSIAVKALPIIFTYKDFYNDNTTNK